MSGHTHNHDNHDHGHGCGHEGGGHSHAPKVNAENRGRVGFAAILTGLFMILEVVGGVISGSLALLADAGHMLTDFAALAMAWAAFKIAQRPANSRLTFGYERMPILIAFVNGLTLFGVAAWIVWEAFHRFMEPGEILAGPMLFVAIAGLVVNLIVFKILMGADQHNLNIRGAVLHVLGDLLGSVAAIVAALVILQTGWMLADPILSILVALLILRSAWGLVKDSAHILLQGAPPHLDWRKIEQDLLENIPELQRLDDIHAWSITPESPILTLQAFIDPEARLEPVALAIKARLAEKFNVDHATVDVSRET